MNDATAKNLALSNMWVAFTAFILACFMGEYQVLERSGLFDALTHLRHLYCHFPIISMS